MALINCPDCNKEISDKAPTCPGCGAPIAGVHEAAGSGVVQLQTIQETSKQLKAQIVWSSLLFWLGVLFFAMTRDSPDSATRTIPAVITIISLLWYIATRYRIWWHHK